VAAVTACSPSAIDSLVQAIGPVSLAEAALVCLGDTTAAAARRASLRVDAVADKTTMESLVLAVRGALGTAQQAQAV
jgi:uroporphyrinogen-III synthase